MGNYTKGVTYAEKGIERIPEAEGLPNSAQKRREAVLLPERPSKKGKERGAGGGEGGRGRTGAVYGLSTADYHKPGKTRR